LNLWLEREPGYHLKNQLEGCLMVEPLAREGARKSSQEPVEDCLIVEPLAREGAR
jgi:hypothetical protein